MRWTVLFAILLACGGDGGGGNPPIDTPAGSDATPGDTPAADTPGGGDAAIAVGPQCDAVTCTNGTQDCCIGGMGDVCEPTGTCPSQGFSCDGPEDCSGSACCYGNGGQGGTSCKAGCAAPACHIDNDCPQATPKCCPKAFTPNYRVCQTAC